MKKFIHNNTQLDFFIADEIDIRTIRDEVASMEHPFFSLRSGDNRTREYKNGIVTVTVTATEVGIATIFDKDIWLYSISKLQQALNDNGFTNRTIYFTPYDFFKTTNRAKGGRSYDELRKTLERLKGTVIKTNIRHSDEKQETTSFGLIDSWRILEEKKGNLDIGMVEITLPDWLFQALENKKVLKLNNEYFKISKAFDRRIYQLARKHCGNQFNCEISLEKLHLKTGSTAIKREFRRSIKNLAQNNTLPDYEVILDSDRDVVIFKNRNPNTAKANKMESLKKGKNVLKQIKKQIKVNSKY